MWNIIKNTLFVLVIIWLGVLLYRILFVPVSQQAVLKAQMNYGSEVRTLCREEDVPYSYIMALIILESSGRKPVPSRFEPAVYDKLRSVRDGTLPRYSTVSHKQLRGLPDSDLKLLASSWGALQIMGYHCFELGISVDVLNTNAGLRHAIRWCKNNYGRYLREGAFADAFHFHNTGRPMPFIGITFTYDPNYVYRGIRYMELFE